LEAELTWVERPDRLEAAATRRLGLVPVTADRIATLDDIDQIAPLRVAPPAVNANPIAPNAASKPAEPVADKSKALAAKPAPVVTVVAR
jgi:hypothetical protein